jgi:rubrerythrin
MELGTFGAILGYAMDLEGRAASFYEQAARAEFAETFAHLAEGSRKRKQRLERARRELVSEMILESISGLDGDAYQVFLDPDSDYGEILRQALAFEAASGRFYTDAGAKMPIREVVRLFGRLARENGRRRESVSACRQACGL